MSLIMFGIFYWLSLPQDMEQIDNTTTILLSAFKNGVNRFLFVLSDAKPELWDKKTSHLFFTFNKYKYPYKQAKRSKY